MKDIDIKDVFKTLTLFFTLSVISVVMIYSNFEQGVENFWENREEYTDAMENSGIYDMIDLDNVKTNEDVYEIDRNKLISDYIENGGESEVFNIIFEKYTDINK